VDDLLARRMWPQRQAVGQRFVGDPWTTGTPAVTITVVGVVRHLRLRQLTDDVREQVFFPVAQAPRNPMAYVVKTTGDPMTVIPQVRSTLAAMDPTLPLHDVRPLSAYVESARAARRFTMLLAGVFAVAALALAAIGVYGVIGYGVTLRRREIGLRLALGATSRQIARMTMGESFRLGAIGLGVGLLGAALAAGLLRTQLYGVSAGDAPAYVLSAIALGAAVALAGWLPSRRATRVDPLETLRAE
jgi:predicted lysophospholipase L1 biosynthesis ABC-type transport system permease subunit